ncbi:putative cytochrome P450 [Talaromyces proteolyticus]|uniref:Cytochrome P450 n=1 Tax=Talaromyces proteolyticus TaxID=1131652 RepID=A0AAD4PZT5_9EURO|nr:putative cytochrome P450 [Talaromyces proteolyticus]KAH8703353.1 putative cytochrome P450 [Talaromyces proteolyticus]
MLLDIESAQSPVTVYLTGIFTFFLAFLTYLSYTPSVNKKSPVFTSYTTPFIGSWGFFTEKWHFWQRATRGSRTRNFSFWLGKNHIVGLSGESARKMFLDHPNMDFVSGAKLVGHGVDFIPPIHPIYSPNVFPNGRSWFQRRLLDLQKSDQLARRLPYLRRDARTAFEKMAEDPSGVTNPSFACYQIVVSQAARVIFTNEISDDPRRLADLVHTLSQVMSTSSLHSVAVPWLPSFPYLKRKYLRYRMNSLVEPIVNRRFQKGAPREDDALQMFLDNRDRIDYIIYFMISALFISTANPGILTGSMLNIVAHHPEWQDKIYNEIKAAAAIHSKNRHAPLVDQLDSIPLEAWETSIPSLDLCFKEAIRMWVGFPMIRLNMSSDPLPIPGTNEVIPANTFVAYNCTEVHYNEELYPNPERYDPDRFREGREEFKKQNYGFVGWGQGRHPCLGTRWAKLQENINMAYALAIFKWSGCDENGNPNPDFSRNTDLNSLAPTLPQGLYCKHVPREEI